MTDVLRVSVNAHPEPGLLRPAIEAALAGRSWPPGPEAQVGAAVAAAVRDSAPGIPTSDATIPGGEGR